MNGHQGLCSALREHSYLFHDCPNWPASLILPGSDYERVKYREMMDSLQSYAMENLAELALTVRTPSVHVVKRDLSMTLVSFVGSLGGLLGLCLGFSFISFIEFFYHIIITRMAGTLAVCCKNDGVGNRKNSDGGGSRRRKHSTIA